jgi:hypothetical protein
MRQTHSIANAAPTRQKRPKLSFRAFYITVLLISAFALITFVADQGARYTRGAQYGAAQRRALEHRDITRLLKRDEEVY